jgi:ABC-type branched-subunit amino acid transport system substrate-binding protein
LTGKLAAEYKALAHFTANNATYAAQAYDATNMIIAALQKVKPVSNLKKFRESIVTELHKLTFKGVTGTIKFQGNGDLTRSSTVDFGQVQSGNIVSIGHS